MRCATSIEYVIGWLLAISFLCFFTLVSLGILGLKLTYTPYLIVGSVMMAFFGLGLFFKKRGFAKLEAANMMICPFCKYDLQNINVTAEDGHWRCPECGSLMDKELVTRLWTDAYKPKSEPG